MTDEERDALLARCGILTAAIKGVHNYKGGFSSLFHLELAESELDAIASGLSDYRYREPAKNTATNAADVAQNGEEYHA
jgi:hypothetical protein